MKYRFSVERVRAYISKDQSIDPIESEANQVLFSAASLDQLLKKIVAWMSEIKATVGDNDGEVILFDTKDLTLSCRISGPNEELSAKDQEKIASVLG